MTSSIELTKRIRYATPNDVFAAFQEGGSVSVEEFPNGEAADAATRAVANEREAGDSTIVLSLKNDGAPGAHVDTVWFHPDEDARLEAIDRARIALDNAEAALMAVGYVDQAHLRGTDYMPVPQREHNAFLIGQDAQRLSSVPSTSTDNALEG
jgi:hypothetical protein